MSGKARMHKIPKSPPMPEPTGHVTLEVDQHGNIRPVEKNTLAPGVYTANLVLSSFSSCPRKWTTKLPPKDPQ